MVEVGLHCLKEGPSARKGLGQGLEERECHKAEELHKALCEKMKSEQYTEVMCKRSPPSGMMGILKEPILRSFNRKYISTSDIQHPTCYFVYFTCIISPQFVTW